jgi:hypothetical protein
VTGETERERRARRRAMRSALSEDQLAHLEDEDFARTKALIGLEGWLAKQPPGRLRKVPIGRPPKSSIQLSHLEAAVDDLRRERARLSKAAVARLVPCSQSALYEWFRNHPGAWDALVVRYRKGR